MAFGEEDSKSTFGTMMKHSDITRQAYQKFKEKYPSVAQYLTENELLCWWPLVKLKEYHFIYETSLNASDTSSSIANIKFFINKVSFLLLIYLFICIYFFIFLFVCHFLTIFKKRVSKLLPRILPSFLCQSGDMLACI
jgi:hypothetical protein